MTIVYSVLLRNSDDVSALAFKHMLRVRLTAMAALLTVALPPLTHSRAAQLLLHGYALIIGLQSIASPTADNLQMAAQEQPPALFTVDFEQEFSRALADLLNSAVLSAAP